MTDKINEDYVSPETAELLKEKGLDASCFRHYIPKYNSDGTCEAVTTCTQQMAMRWLRKNYKLHIVIDAYPHSDGCFYWYYKIMHLCKNEVVFGYYNKAVKAGFDSYEEAVEAALKYSLENLI